MAAAAKASAAGERGGGQFRAERGLAGGVPCAAVDGFAEHAAAGAAEQPPVRRAAMLVEVAAEHADQHGREGNDADRAVWAVLETARLVRGPGAGPGTAGTRAGRGEDQLPAAVHGQDQIAAAYVEIFNMLADAIPGPVLCQVLNSGVGLVQNTSR